MGTPMIKFFKDRPWLLVVLAFIILIGALAHMITVAVKNAPEQVHVPKASHAIRSSGPSSGRGE